MRTIKFRGKTNSGKWLYGNLQVPVVKGVPYFMWTSHSEGHHQREVQEDTIGQFTGFKDINGTEIYEGDVLKNAFSEKPFGVVSWNEYGGYFFIDCSVIPIQWNNSYRPLGEMIDVKIDDKPVNLEVIGNIHDNPELFPKDK